MKKAIILAIVSCFLFSSVAFAFESNASDTSKSSYTEQMKKKKKSTKKSKKAAAPATTAN